MRYKITKKDAEVLLFSVILHKLSLMKMKISRILALLLVGMLPLCSYADIEITGTYTAKDGSVVSKTDEIVEEAPLHVSFVTNLLSLEEGQSAEWHFNHRTATSSSSVTRYGETAEFDFLESGITTVTFYLMQNDEVIDADSMTVTISESHLEMPNAFSPNDDGNNDVYCAKGALNPEAEGRYKSIVEFHAYIFNRWGQKLYEWTDIEGGWDGTYNGSPVKDGVYFVVVKARGADGIEYNIRRDVNLIRKFNKTEE